MLLDANVLIYAFDDTSPYHRQMNRWLTDAFESGRRIAIPTQSVTAFVRIVTHPKLFSNPASPETAARIVRRWLEMPTAWIPPPGPGFADIFCDLLERHRPTGNLVSDLSLAALALEHGLPVVSADSDFAQWPELTWINPLTAG